MEGKSWIYIAVGIGIVAIIIVVVAMYQPIQPKGQPPTVAVPKGPVTPGPVAPGPEAPGPSGPGPVVPGPGPLPPAGEATPGGAPTGEVPGGGNVPPAPETKKSPLGEFNPEAPAQTGLLKASEIPEGVIKMTISSAGFDPKEFTVSPGQTVSLVLTSPDTTHILRFDSPDLSNIRLGVTRKQTRGISFVAPTKKGDYTFYCDVPGHRGRGEKGVMHVK